jgi:hypothetical protein
MLCRPGLAGTTFFPVSLRRRATQSASLNLKNGEPCSFCGLPPTTGLETIGKARNAACRRPRDYELT